MTHAERVRDAERAVVEAAVACEKCPVYGDWLACCDDLTEKTIALLALRAATCQTCGGKGTEEFWDGVVPCPAGCDEGRRIALNEKEKP